MGCALYRIDLGIRRPESAQLREAWQLRRVMVNVLPQMYFSKLGKLKP